MCKIIIGQNTLMTTRFYSSKSHITTFFFVILNFYHFYKFFMISTYCNHPINCKDHVLHSNYNSHYLKISIYVAVFLCPRGPASPRWGRVFLLWYSFWRWPGWPSKRKKGTAFRWLCVVESCFEYYLCKLHKWLCTVESCFESSIYKLHNP